MKKITKVRFDALAGYARKPMARWAAEELGGYSVSDDAALGLLIMDRGDQDFAGVVFARDEKLRFRSVEVTQFYPTVRRAEVELRRAMEAAALAAPEDHWQGDEVGAPVDFFAYSKPRERLNPDFIQLAESPGYIAARRIIEPMMRWYEDADGNFIEQFQTTGFDQRIWELYLFATFVEMGYELSRKVAVPDFNLEGPYGKLAIEAVTVAATQGGQMDPPPDITTEAGMADYLAHYMPIKFGSPLFSKLNKRYWEQPDIAGQPLAFAIEDFSSPGSMIFTRSAISRYLYGYEYDWRHDETGVLVITPRKITEHRWGAKVIPSGFFDQPDTENISAVIFSNSGTIAKFNRMGVLAEFGEPDVMLVREGNAMDHDPNAAHPQPFVHLVNATGYDESWVEALEVFHNPKALHPLNPLALPGAAHHTLLPDGQVDSQTPDWMPLSSRTQIFHGVTLEQFQELAQRAASGDGAGR